LAETRLSGYDEQGQTIAAAVRVGGTEMPGALPDVLSSDGQSVFMRHIALDPGTLAEKPQARHLFSSVGFLNDTWWHRTYFIYGEDFRSGWGGWWQVGNRVPAGRLLVMNKDSIFGFGRSFIPHGNSGQWNLGEFYRTFATDRDYRTIDLPAPKNPKKRRGAVTGKTLVKYRWSKASDLEARAMVLAGDTLFVAGPLGETTRSAEAFQGQAGIRLRAIRTTDGSMHGEYNLSALPVHDGLVAAGGRLFLATKDGRLSCYGKD
jgi:hypothetical protein